MRFWDSAAVVALLCPEVESRLAERLRDADPALVVWHWTPVECVSALQRRLRDGSVVPDVIHGGVRRLQAMRRAWTEVVEHDAVRRRAERCLRHHPLRAADAGQLAAALVFVERLGQDVAFVSFDGRLVRAAQQEGFEVLGPTE